MEKFRRLKDFFEHLSTFPCKPLCFDIDNIFIRYFEYFVYNLATYYGSVFRIGHPRRLFHLFLDFTNKQSKFYNKLMSKMSVQ